jgi:hypothetical protein
MTFTHVQLETMEHEMLSHKVVSYKDHNPHYDEDEIYEGESCNSLTLDEDNK